MKNKLRKNIRLKRNNLSEEDKNLYETDICSKLEKIIPWDKVNTILSYFSFGNELSTNLINKLIIDRKKTLLLPQVDNKDKKLKAISITPNTEFFTSSFGIQEPIGNEELEPDLFIVPAIALDKQGNRIGYGAGYYDKYLKDKKGIKIGIIYDFQLVDELKVEAHDISMDIVISATK